jgi:hypothetical protein
MHICTHLYLYFIYSFFYMPTIRLYHVAKKNLMKINYSAHSELSETCVFQGFICELLNPLVV